MRFSRPGSRPRIGLAIVAVASLATLSLSAVPAAAAPTRYEAENATIVQGVAESVHAGFSGTGYVNYNNVADSAVEWTVNAAAAGSATLAFRHANGSTGTRPMRITINGDAIDGAVVFNTTGAWTTYATVTVNATLAAGSNTVRATAISANGGPNMDYLEVETATDPGPGDLQAENATIVQGVVESNHAGFTGTGFVNYNNVVGSYVEWTVSGASAGAITLRIRYANGTTGNRPMDITVNGALVGNDVPFAPTGAWTTWQEAVVAAELNNGTNTVRATAVTAGGGPNVDRLTLGSGGNPSPPTVPGNPRVTGTTSSSISLAWDASTDDVGVVGYRVREGNTVVANPTGTSATISGLAPQSTHTYTIAAVDTQGLESGRSAPVTGTTQGGGGGNTPVEINGQLRVCGTRLCNQHGHPIQLRGMSTHGLQWHANCINNASLNALATDWNADILRISMYIQEGGYETNPRRFTDLVHSIIEQVTARGMYFIVDWHMLSPGNPHFNLARARTFFTEIAQRHRDKPNILYEVANEPSGVSWATIKSYHEQIIPVIRAQDPDSIILLGTRAWSSLGVSDGGNEAETVNNPVNASNVMYTFHFYAASHGAEYRNALSRAADRIPMFVTEFGTQTFTGGGGNDFNSSQQYLDLMASKKISWTNWNYSHDPLSGAAFTQGTCPGGPFTGTSRLKPAGAWIRDRIRTPDNFPTG